MRIALAAAAFLLASITAVSAQTPAAPIAAPAAQFDIPPGAKPQTVTVGRYELPAGTTNPIRVHPGVEMAQIAQGDLEYWTKGKPMRVYHPGETLVIPRGEQYQVRVASTVAVILYGTLVTDQGVPSSPILPGALIH